MKHLLSLSVVLGLAGCTTVGPDYERPVTTTPESWHQPSPSTTHQTDRLELSHWWESFGDETLTELILQASDENLDVKTAFARVEEALALRAAAKGERAPVIGASADLFETQLSDASGGAGRDQPFELYSLGVDASWEMDVWGRISRSIEASDATYQATVEDYRDSLVLLYGQLASSYMSVRELQLRIELAEENIQRQKESQALTQGRFNAGLAPALDVNQAVLNLSRTEAALPELERLLAENIHRISVLSGKAPGALHDLLSAANVLPSATPAFPSTVPADVLRQRPDVRAAEQRLIAQTARIGVATADLYPRLSLTGSFSFESTEPGDLFQSASQSFRIGPSVRWSLFQGGRIRANIDAAEARAEQSVYQYRSIVLGAFEEVENSFVAYNTEARRLTKLKVGVDAAKKTVSQVRSLYENGLVDFLNVLDAERSLATQQDSYASSLGTQSRNVVRIYRSLGGGWDAPEAQAPAASPTLRPAETHRIPLAKHEALVRFKGIRFNKKPDPSGRSRAVAVFTVEEYQKFQRLTEEADGIFNELTIPLEHQAGYALVPEALRDQIDALTPGERMNLEWSQDHVTRAEISANEIHIQTLTPLRSSIEP